VKLHFESKFRKLLFLVFKFFHVLNLPFLDCEGFGTIPEVDSLQTTHLRLDVQVIFFQNQKLWLSLFSETPLYDAPFGFADLVHGTLTICPNDLLACSPICFPAPFFVCIIGSIYSNFPSSDADDCYQ